MKVSQIGLRFPYLLTICFALGACSGMRDGLVTAASVSPSPEPTTTRRIPAATSVSFDSEPTQSRQSPTATTVSTGSEPTKTRQALAPTRQSPTAASTCRPSDEVGLVKITRAYEEYVSEVYWSENGESVRYATLVIDEQGKEMRTWWEYDVERDNRHEIASPFDWDDWIWKQLGAKHRGKISPSGEYILYMRVSPGYDNYTPASGEGPWGPPVEVWAARSDGGRAWKVYGPYGGCRTLGDVVWFDEERRVVFDCGYEGPSTVLIAQVNGSSVVALRGTTAFTDSLGYAGMALSRDETMLALTGQFGNLQIVPLDGSDVRHIARYGSSPSWSFDSRRVYYMRTEKEWGDSADIYMYDLDVGTDTRILPSPLCTPDGTELYMRQSPFAVSPLENAAVIFASGSLWLATWSP
jgi:hypothetical protein